MNDSMTSLSEVVAEPGFESISASPLSVGFFSFYPNSYLNANRHLQQNQLTSDFFQCLELRNMEINWLTGIFEGPTLHDGLWGIKHRHGDLKEPPPLRNRMYHG